MQLFRPFSTATHPHSFFDLPTFRPEVDEAFPVVYSTLAPHALTHLIFQHYEIEVPKGCRFWHRGLSDVYLVETISQPYILRVSHHHWRTKSAIDFELDLLTFLAVHQLPVAAPLRTKRGFLSIEVNAPEGKRYAALFPVASGTVAIGDLNKTQGFLLGEVVAQLHRVSQSFSPLAHRQPLTLSYLLDDSLHAIAPFMNHHSQEWDYLMETSSLIKEQVKNLPKEAPYWTVCWGDPHSGNVHFTEENQLTLFDFDQCGYGWRAFDIGKFLQVSLQTGLNRTVREAFLAGYQAVTPLTHQELASLQSLTQMAYIWSWAIHLNSVKLYDYSRLDSYYFNNRLQRLKQLRSPDWQLF